jgi:N-acetylneuraminate synthase/N,N'-diacetyllegionaminate synthase
MTVARTGIPDRQSLEPDPEASIVNPQSPIPDPQSSIVNRQSSIPTPSVAVGGKRIGPTHPVYIIAEAGVNHDGDIAVAHKLIDAAHRAGADAVKFQVFSADRLVAASAPSCAYQEKHDRHAGTQREMLRRLELEPAAFGELEGHAKRLNIDFLATPFGPAELDFLIRDLRVPAIKIASSDLVNVPLLTAAAASDLPLILSTGASSLSEIDQAVGHVRRARTPDPRSASPDVQSPAGQQLILLHCVSAYPTDPDNARLACIRTLAGRFNVPVGFSDHTPDAGFSALAVAAGAVVLEKHLTLERHAAGPDHFFSLLPEQFGRYVTAARQARAALGDGEVGVAPEEDEVRRLARGSIVSAVALAAGQTLTAGDLAVQRPGDGLEPARWNEVIGRVTKTDIPKNTRLSWSMLR